MASKPPHILIVEARFYDDLADALLQGAARALEKAGATFEVVTVMGALEIPAAIAFAIDGESRRGAHYDGFVALGIVIRGQTHHFEIVANESARALMDISVGRHVAIGNGILTVENERQAWVRARPEELDKGGFAARAALKMVELKRHFGS